MTAPHCPHCPRCNSTFYSPDPSNGGAGRNKCISCGVASPVAEWYAPSLDAIAQAALNIAFDQIFNELFMQQPEPPTPGYRTGNMRPAKPHELHPDEPAPTSNPHYWWQDD